MQLTIRLRESLAASLHIAITVVKMLTAFHLAALLGGGRVAHDCRPSRESLDSAIPAVLFTILSRTGLGCLDLMVQSTS